MVKMADGAARPVDCVQRGDVVEGGFTVACVMRTTVGKHVQMTHLPGLCITPWHTVQAPYIAGNTPA